MKFNYTPDRNNKSILVLDGQELSAGAVELPDNYEDYGIFVSMVATKELTLIEQPKVEFVVELEAPKAKTTRKKAVVDNVE